MRTKTLPILIAAMLSLPLLAACERNKEERASMPPPSQAMAPSAPAPEKAEPPPSSSQPPAATPAPEAPSGSQESQKTQ